MNRFAIAVLLLALSTSGCRYPGVPSGRNVFAHAHVAFWYPHGQPDTLALVAGRCPNGYVAPYWVCLEGFAARDKGAQAGITIGDSTHYKHYPLEVNEVGTFDSLTFKVLDAASY